MEKRSPDVLNRVRTSSLVALAIASCSAGGCGVEKHQRIAYEDVNRDGIEDVVIDDHRNDKYIAFLGKKDGSFEKTNVDTRDGVLYFVGNKGTYTYDGKYMPHDSYIITDLKSSRKPVKVKNTR